MSWRVELPGQPPTVNRAYEPQTAYRRTRDGGSVPYTRIGKSEQYLAYKAGATQLAKVARPSGWHWCGGFVRLVYRFYLSRDADCDNLLKAIDDALAAAIAANDPLFNDRWFLPMVFSKRLVRDHEARVEITVIQEGDEEWAALEALADRPDELP